MANNFRVKTLLADNINISGAITGSNLSGTNTGDETDARIASLITSATSKATPVDADEIPITDSAASFGLKKLSWANLKATAKTYFDSLYISLTGDQTIAGAKTFSDNVVMSGNLTVDTDTLFVDSTNNWVGIGTAAPAAKLHTVSETEQLRVGYDASNYVSTTVDSAGLVTLDAAGTSAGFALVKPVTATTQPALSALTDTHVITKGIGGYLYGPLGKYDNHPATTTGLQGNSSVAKAPLFDGRYDQTYPFNYGNPAGAKSNIVFVPFFQQFPKTYTKAAIHVRAGAHPTAVVYGAIYLPDENGYPKLQQGSTWAWDVSATGKTEATISVGEIQGLFYIGILPELGSIDWRAGSAAAASLGLLGVNQSAIGGMLSQLFGVPQTLLLYDQAMSVVSTGAANAGMPSNLSSPEIRRMGMWGAGNSAPVAILY